MLGESFFPRSLIILKFTKETMIGFIDNALVSKIGFVTISKMENEKQS